MRINTPTNIAAKLGISTRNVQLLIKKLEITPIEMIGKTQIISDADVKRIEKRKTTPGREKKSK
jgi:hypothetical protein